MSEWLACNKILCIRADNMGDVLMCVPAIRALKETFVADITLLTSSKGKDITKLIGEIDSVLVYDFPWVQTNEVADNEHLLTFIEELKKQEFDGCIIFSVYSQNSLPSAMMAYLAGIPLRLAYSRENPYALLSHWIPDKEPYSYILHQVERDLKLVESIGAVTANRNLSLQIGITDIDDKIKSIVGRETKNFLVLHPGVSEEKRRYPSEKWIEIGKAIYKEFGIPLLVTGSVDEEALVNEIVSGIGNGAFSFAGKLTIEELADIIKKAKALVSVNTGTIHIAAALQTFVIVLYAQSNPQHIPWMVPHICLEYSIPFKSRSRNEVIKFVNDSYYKQWKAFPSSFDVLKILRKLLDQRKHSLDSH